MIGAGRLNRRITIRRPVVTTNDFGDPIETLTTLATIWAHKHDVSANEAFRAQEVGAQLTTRFTIRYSATEVVRYAGARVGDDEIYELAFAGADAQETVLHAVMNLMKMMVPTSARAKLEAAIASGETQPTEGADSGNSRPTAKASSKKRTRQRSAKNG